MPTTEEIERLAKRYGALVREPSPWDQQHVHQLPVKIIPYESELLRKLRTKYKDEREWASMLGFHMCRGPVEHLLMGVMSEGFDIVAGKSAAAKKSQCPNRPQF